MATEESTQLLECVDCGYSRDAEADGRWFDYDAFGRLICHDCWDFEPGII